MPQKSTKTAKDVSDIALGMGDQLVTNFNKTKDLKVAHVALKAYNTSLKAHRDIMVYKKQTGKPASIPYYENI